MTREQAENILLRIPVFAAGRVPVKSGRPTKRETAHKRLKTNAIFKTPSSFCDTDLPQNKAEITACPIEKAKIPAPEFYSFQTVAQEKKCGNPQAHEWTVQEVPECETALYRESNAGHFYAQLTGHFMDVNVSEKLYVKLRERLTSLRTVEQIRQARERQERREREKRERELRAEESSDFPEYERKVREEAEKARRRRITILETIGFAIIGFIVALVYLVSLLGNCSTSKSSGTTRTGAFSYAGYTNGDTVYAKEYTRFVTFPSSNQDGKSVITIGKPLSSKGNADLQDAKIPEGIETIGSSAFYKCTSLSYISLPESIRRIEQTAFAECSALQSITLPSGVRTVEHFAFMNCTKLSQVTVKSEQLDLTNLSFQGCMNIAELTAPAGIIYCFPRRNLRVATITTGERIDMHTFNQCAQLEQVTMSDDILYIGENAFYECTSLKNLAMSQSVTHIGKSAFSGCSALTEIRLPRTLESIGAYAFAGCNRLQIEFTGTVDEWNAVQKGEDWDIGLRNSSYVIRCADGNVTVGAAAA